MSHVNAAIGASSLQGAGYRGAGVGVALIDTGVVPVPGLTSGNIVHGADLSFESQDPAVRHLDTFGHGTHMAGIIAGNGAAFRGVAPQARLTSVKVAGSDGAVDVSQVIAAVDWVVAHRNDDPANPIRVLNLSYGTDAVQHYRYDPLTHAVENAWRAGIVVVVAAGNEGFGTAKLNNPAHDPFVIAVGAADTQLTQSASDDTVMDFSSRGDASRRVDLVAPGRSVLSLRSQGSALDELNPGAREGSYFKGSGTSQAAAAVSGAVALLLQAKPTLSPDQVKALLKQSASPMAYADPASHGAGALNVDRALENARSYIPRGVQWFAQSTGRGSLEAARGSMHVSDHGVELTGERHILGPFNAHTWAPASATFSAWAGGTWGGAEWTGACSCEWTTLGRAWSGRTWSGASWTGRTWSGRTWSGRTWSGRIWSAGTWSGRTWSGRTWSAGAWF